MIMIILRAAAVLIALFSILNALFSPNEAAFATVHGMCMLLGGIVAYLLAKFLNRSPAVWTTLAVFFVFVTLLILAFMPTGKSADMSAMIGRLRKIVEGEPANSSVHYHLGLAYLSANDNSAAMEEYEALKNLKSNRAEKLLSHIDKHQALMKSIDNSTPSRLTH